MPKQTIDSSDIVPVDKKRFWDNVNKSGPSSKGIGCCWIWNGCHTDGGYGNIRMMIGRNLSTHRFSWLLHGGSLRKGMYICHRCDVKDCVNPDHLFIGTPQDNTNDMMSKGRMRHVSLKGVSNGRSKLNEDNVRCIRRLHSQGVGVKKLIEKYGVSEAVVYRVVNKKSWSHVKWGD